MIFVACPCGRHLQVETREKTEDSEGEIIQGKQRKERNHRCDLEPATDVNAAEQQTKFERSDEFLSE